MTLRAAVIGINWGQVHIHAFNELGVEIIGLCATQPERLHEVAKQHSIPFTTTDPATLLRLPLDVISIATPATTHSELLSLFRQIPIICEKPLVGLEGPEPIIDERRAPLWINYAFAFLDSARQIRQLLPGLGKVHQLEMCCEYELPLNFTAAQWWLEVASHPLSFLLHLFGEPATVSHKEGEALAVKIGNIPARLICRQASGINGIRQQLRFHTDAGLLELNGHFQMGSPWRYEPLILAGKLLNDGEWCSGDCWIRANVRSFEAIMAQLQGRHSLLEGISNGLFTAAKAWPIDRLLRQTWLQG